MKRRLIVLTLCLVLVISLWTPLNTFASTSEAGSVQPYFTYISSVKNAFDISSSGNASMSSSIVTYNGTVDQVRMNNYLQRYNNGLWTTVNNWSQTTQGTSAAWSQSYYVSSGYSYRLRTYFYAYDGSTIIESTSATSSSIYY
jgi:hypothetical protein